MRITEPHNERVACLEAAWGDLLTQERREQAMFQFWATWQHCDAFTAMAFAVEEAARGTDRERPVAEWLSEFRRRS